MGRIRRFLLRLAAFGRPHRAERDLTREVTAHLTLLEDEFRRRGMSAEDARFAARRAFGGVEQAKEHHRDARSFRWLNDARQDTRYAVRSLARNPGFTVVALLTLALGIGANTAIFSLVDAVLLRHLPVHEPKQLVQLLMALKGGEVWESFSYPLVRALADQRDIFAGVCGFSGATFNIGPSDALERTSGAWMSGACYETLGLRPAAGRLLGQEDDGPRAVPAAVISDRYWRRQFARDRGVVGRQLLIEGVPVMIVGITPPGFTGASVGEASDVTMTLAVLPQLYPERAESLQASSTWLRVLARPRPGISMAQVKAYLGAAWPQLADSAVPASMAAARSRVFASTLEVTPGATGTSALRRPFRQPLLVLMAVVAVVLVIACVNVANLLLARSTARHREMAVRLAIGAGRGRIIRQLLTESAVLSLFGAAVGTALAPIGSRLLVALLSSGRPDAIVLDFTPNLQVYGFTTAVALMTSLLFGMAPAFRASTFAPGVALTANSSRIAGSRGRLASALVTAQVSLSLLLLIGAGLFVGTLQNLRTLDPGFRHEGVLLVDVDGLRAGYRGARLGVFNRELLERVAHLPGVVSASMSSVTPLSGGAISHTIAVKGQPASVAEIYFNNVAPRYFETMRTRVLLGREFTDRDDVGAPGVVIVNEAFVRQYVPEGNAVGRHLSISNPSSDFQIVGVVRDAVYETLREPPRPTVYAPYLQRGAGRVTFEVFASGPVAQVVSAIRAELQPRLPRTPVHVRTLTAQLEASLIQERLMATLAGSFGALAVVLGAIGLYGVLAYNVAQRTSEIGIRMALGARRSQVIGLVVRQAVVLTGVGIAVGLCAAALLTRYLAKMLFGLTPLDAATFVAASLLFATVAIVASYLPARRAVNVDPLLALRCE